MKAAQKSRCCITAKPENRAAFFVSAPGLAKSTCRKLFNVSMKSVLPKRRGRVTTNTRLSDFITARMKPVLST